MTDRIDKAIEALEYAQNYSLFIDINGVIRPCEAGKQLYEITTEALALLRQPSPTMMPPLDVLEAMAWVEGEGVDEIIAALSCDAFQNWLGGVGRAHDS